MDKRFISSELQYSVLEDQLSLGGEFLGDNYHTTKRSNGIYYTEGNPFHLKPFLDWAVGADFSHSTILEPFAGANNIIKMLQQQHAVKRYASFDISPQDENVKKKDTIKNFPEGYNVVITNPPWLAKNSATRRGIDFHYDKYDDIYKYCLDLCLLNCRFVAAIIPATFLQSKMFLDRLDTFIFLQDKNMFSDTDNPVALALFIDKDSGDVKIYKDNRFIGCMNELEKYIPQNNSSKKVIFNHPHGELGLIAFDNTKEPTIRFVKGVEIPSYKIKHTTRMITRIKVDVDDLNESIDVLNRNNIELFRIKTSDVFLTTFKGLREDGEYRRRMDYKLAKCFIEKYAR